MITWTNRLSLMIILLTGAISAAYAQAVKPLISVEKIDPQFSNIVSKTINARIIAQGFAWCEGPLWIESHKMLLFSDVKKNIIYKWTQAKGKEVYLTPAGYTGKTPRGGELGSNGLGLNIKGELVICQDGDRVISIMNAPLQKPQAKFTKIATGFKGKKFDSPNDLAFAGNGDIYFTDPPYGLEKNINDPLKEAPYQGVYKIAKDGKITLLTDTLTRPNGIAIFPGGKTILIANSDPAKPYWYAYDLDKNGLLTHGRIFYNAKAATKTAEGMPDGLKIDKNGNVFASGPGGIWIFNKIGKLLGKIKINDVASNCSFSAAEKTLYVTSNHRVLMINLR
jgi:gluconolactonase